jgi:proteasome maturation protein
MASSVPMLTAPHDALREGLTDARAALAPQHPVERMQKERRARELDAKVRDLTAQQGVAAAIKCRADHMLLSSFHRMPGLPSSFAGLDNYT